MLFKAFVNESGLSQEDKNLWFLMLERLNDKQVKILEDFIDGKEENLKELAENFKAKRRVFEDLDKKSLEEIIKAEQQK